MKKNNLFSFTVAYFGFLKKVPLFPQIFDSLFKLWLLFFKIEMLDWYDEIEAEILSWKNTTVIGHRYGGMQFNYEKREIGHLHSNGLLDVLYQKECKQELIRAGRVSPHHVFENSGWISFYIRTYDDVQYAKTLLALAYQRFQ